MGDGWVRAGVENLFRILDGSGVNSRRARSASVFLVVVVILGKGGKRRVRDVSEGVLVAKDRNAVSTRGAGTRERDLAIGR